MRVTKASVIWAMLFLALFSRLGFGQTEKDSWENLKQLKVGQKIQVVDMKMKSLEGKFVSFSEEAISLRVGKNDVAVERPNVLRVNQSDSSRRTRNMLIGMAALGGAGLAVGMVIDAPIRNEGGTPIYAGILAGAGVGAGAAAGALSPGYRTIYRGKKPQPGKAP